MRARIQQIHTLLLQDETFVRTGLLTRLQGKQLERTWGYPGSGVTARLPRLLADLETLLVGNPPQQARLRRVKTLVDGELMDLAYAMATGPEAVIPPGGRLPPSADEFLVKSQRVLSELNVELTAMLDEEDRNLEERQARARVIRMWNQVAIAGGALFGLGGGVLAMLLLTSGIVERVRRSEKNARRLAEGRPLEPMPAGTDEIGRLGVALEESRALLVEREEGLRQAKERTELANTQLAELNRTLEDKVNQQVEEIQRMARLKRYLSPQVASTVLEGAETSLFQGQRGEITAVFIDLRGFTAFSDSSEPEEVLELLRTYHGEMGEIIFRYQGTIERFAGDGMMVFFNAPLPMPDHVERAARMSLEMQERARELRQGWVRRGHDLDVGIGLAAGYATLGEIGFEGRRDYAAIGNVTNLAARLSGAALGGQILTNQRTLSRIDHLVEAQPLEALTLKGLARPVPVFNILRLKRSPSHA